MGPEGVGGTGSRYGLHGPGIESRWGRDFPHPALGTTQHRVQWAPLLFQGGIAGGVWRGVDHPPIASSTEVKEKVVLYLYSPSTPHLCLHGKL